MEKRRREIEEASLRARREYEVTIKNLDYQRVILHNQKYYDMGEFKCFEELMKFMSTIEVGKRIWREFVLNALL
jgi:hypothetical protein